MLKAILRWLGMVPTEEDEKLKTLVDASYKHIRVSPRGRLSIDPKEVAQTPEFKQALQQAKLLIQGQCKHHWLPESKENGYRETCSICGLKAQGSCQ